MMRPANGAAGCRGRIARGRRLAQNGAAMTFMRPACPDPAPGTTQAGQRGFALLIVLWALVLLALLAATITATGRSETRIAGNLVGAANAEAAADGGVAAAMFHLLITSNQHWAADGVVHQLVVGHETVNVAIYDQDGMVDPNQSPPALIAALLRQIGLDDTAAQTLANAIVDWRTPTDGGLLPQYQAAGREFGPPHQPFQSAAELGLVLGMTPRITALLAPHINPYVQSTPNPNLADPVVAAALTDAMNRDHITLDPATTDGPQLVLISATAGGPAGTFTRRALIRFDSSNDPPFTTLEWYGG